MRKKAFVNIVGKEKMLVTSIFFFSNNVFHPAENKFPFYGLHLFCHHYANAFNLDQFKILLFVKELNVSQMIVFFSEWLGNTLGKGENAVNQHFSPFPA